MSIKDSKTEENKTIHGRTTGVHGRASQAEIGKVGTTSARLVHGHPCA